MRALEYLALEKVCKSENVTYQTKHVMAVIFDKFKNNPELPLILAHFAAESLAFDYDLTSEQMNQVEFKKLIESKIPKVISEGYMLNLSTRDNKFDRLTSCVAKFNQAKEELRNSIRVNPTDKISETQFNAQAPQPEFTEDDKKRALLVQQMLPKNPASGRR